MEEIIKTQYQDTEHVENIELNDEAGMTTAELLGNAALAIAALVAVWALLQQIGIDVMTFVRSSIGV